MDGHLTHSAGDRLSHLFECLLLVGLDLDPENPKSHVPYIKSKFPLEVEVPPGIETLCFPDADQWRPSSKKENKVCNLSTVLGEERCYSFVLTGETGKRKYGYCRRLKPEGAQTCLPLVYCIITPHQASGFFVQILAELESRHGELEIQFTEFLEQLYNCRFPNPGSGLSIKVGEQQWTLGNGSKSDVCPPGNDNRGTLSSESFQFHVQRPYDSRWEERDLTRLFGSLKIPVLLQVFNALLAEEKIIFLSKSVSQLSSCVEALTSILFPFSWQHTLIPVLPSCMLEVCQAPTPYIVGVLKSPHNHGLPVFFSDGIVIDIDVSAILQKQCNKNTILPTSTSQKLKDALEYAQKSTLPDHPARNVKISEAFIKTFLEVSGHYHAHLRLLRGGKLGFDRDSFIQAPTSRSIRKFLGWFTETAMFHAFIESHIWKTDLTNVSNEESHAVFLKERNRKSQPSQKKSSHTLGARFKNWNPFKC